MKRSLPWLLSCAALTPACEDREPVPSAGAPWFEECALESGIQFQHVSGHTDRYWFPEIMCTGAALFDMDGDGDLDAYLVQAGKVDAPPSERPPNKLFKNRGDGTFDDVTQSSGAGDRGYGMGVATGDVDNDGDVDLYVTNLDRNALLLNDGQGRFRDVSQESGTALEMWSTGAAFFDYDADGDLDLYVANYLRWTLDDELYCEHPPLGPDYCSPNSYGAPHGDSLLRNDGGAFFRDVTVAARLPSALGNGLGVACADFDDDGRTDVFVANDGMPNILWRNLGDGRFEDVALARGCALDSHGQAKAGMGIDIADLDQDGDEDLLVVNLDGESDSFYRNERRVFSDHTPLVGLGRVSRGFTRFGCGLVDFDNDGWLDLFEANGRVTRASEPQWEDPYAEPNVLLRGTPSGRFEEVLPRGGTAVALVATSRAAAFGDVDGDGAVDVLVANRDGGAYLLRNVAPSQGNFARLEVVEPNGRSAYGAVLQVRAGPRQFRTEVRSSRSYCSASDPRIHIGLGALSSVDEVRVRWVDGTREVFGPFAAGASHRLMRGAGTAD